MENAIQNDNIIRYDIYGTMLLSSYRNYTITHNKIQLRTRFKTINCPSVTHVT